MLEAAGLSKEIKGLSKTYVASWEWQVFITSSCTDKLVGEHVQNGEMWPQELALCGEV